MSETLTPEQAIAEHQIRASYRYADLLYSQLRSHTSENNAALRHIAMLMCAMLEREGAINRGDAENDAASWGECIATLTSCVANYLGCNVAITPSRYPPEIGYYEIEYRHPERGSFSIRASIPAPTSIAAYARYWELHTGGKLNSIRSITEEEWRTARVGKSKESKGNPLPPIVQGFLQRKPASLLERDLRFPPEEVMLLEHFEKTGILKAYSDTLAMVLVMLSQAPAKDIDNAFLGYLGSVVPWDRKIPMTIHAKFMEELGGGKVTYFQSNSIVMILSDGEIRRFVPLPTISGTGKRSDSVELSGLKIASRTPLTQWNKTRCGYVPPEQHVFLESLLHARGDFGRNIQPVPLRGRAARLGEAPKPIGPPLDLGKVRFTHHALERFAERFPEQAKGDCEKGALALLAKATEDGAISKVGYVRRVIDNNFERARYFRAGRCRFVIKEKDGTFEVVTIEYAHLT